MIDMYYINLISPLTKPFMRYRLNGVSFNTIKEARAFCYREIVSKRNAKINPYDVPTYAILSSDDKIQGHVWMGVEGQPFGEPLWSSGIGRKTYYVHADGSTEVVRFRR